MATLVLTSIGTALGGPLGGALGSLVGQSIDQQLFGPGIRKGPRLGDLSVQTSSYGSSIPRIYGTMRVAGTVVWATDLVEEETIEGGGKGSPERLAYNYSANLAVALSSRPIKAVRRIWADGKLIRGAAGDFKVQTKFRLLTGHDDQAIDPLIASVETIAQTPAYRGLALALFEELQLAEFGNRIPLLTFEVEADDGPVALAALLADASGGAIIADDPRPVRGFAAHGSSIADGIGSLVELCGIELVEREGVLRSPSSLPPVTIGPDEVGCGADDRSPPRLERRRSPDAMLPGSIALTYYDPDRDYQAGQMRASSGGNGARDERIELPAVLDSSDAKLMVEGALSRRWRAADQLRLTLSPSRMGLRPGDRIRPPGVAGTWTIRTALIEGMAVSVTAEMAAGEIGSLPSDPGRSVSEPDQIAGRSELLLFELPAMGDAPESTVRAQAAASNQGLWKPVPVELTLGGAPLAPIGLTRRSIAGRAETVPAARTPSIRDELSTVTVRLFNASQALMNADMAALMDGANLALLGEELIQFGRAEELEAGLYRLSSLLRGRRGTEWAASTHVVGEGFWLTDPGVAVAIELSPSAVGSTLTATAHGIGDVAPLPVAERLVSGEAMRPLAPCHVRLWRDGATVHASWVRRSHRGWAWNDGVEVGEDPFPEIYRLTLAGSGGQAVSQTSAASASFGIEQVPAQAGQQLSLSIERVGPMALSRPATTSIIL
jgi:hypothetical protein